MMELQTPEGQANALAKEKHRKTTTRVEFPLPVQLKQELLASLTGVGELPKSQFPRGYFKQLFLPYIRATILNPKLPSIVERAVGTQDTTDLIELMRGGK